MVNIISTYITYYDNRYIQRLDKTIVEGENVEKTAVYVGYWRKSKPL
jgi:hypothetical protein